MTVTTLIPVDWWDDFEPPAGSRAEIIGGGLVLSPSASKQHALVQWRVQLALSLAVPAGFEPVSGLEWRLTNETFVASAPIPDVMVVPESGDDLAPILAVEVLSPSDHQRLASGMSRIEGKRLDYAAHGLPHYVEVDLADRSITRFHLVGDELIVVEHVTRTAVKADEPFPYLLSVSDLFG